MLHSLNSHPEHRIVFISGRPLLQVLAPLCESIPARLTLVSTDFSAALLAKDFIGDTLSPTIPSLLRLAGEAVWPLTLLTRPRIRPP